MRRSILAVAAAMFGLTLVIATYPLLSKRGAMTTGAYAVPEDVAARLKQARITLADSPSVPRITREAAIRIARQHFPGDPGSGPTATYGLATNDPETTSGRGRMQDRPVWVVSFTHGAMVERSGPVDSPLPRVFSGTGDVLVDADTGDFVMAIQQSTAPITQPSPGVTEP